MSTSIPEPEKNSVGAACEHARRRQSAPAQTPPVSAEGNAAEAAGSGEAAETPEAAATPDRSPATEGAVLTRHAARKQQEAAGPKPNPEPEDTGSAGDNWRRLRHAGAIKWSKSQVLTGVLCALLGFALVAQIQQTEEKGISQLSQSDLVRVLNDVDSRNTRLEAEARDLQRSQEDLQSGTDKQRAAREQSEARARDLSILAGTVPVQGPGIVVSINREGLNSASVVTLVQELRDAGAEAIEINGHRIVVNTWFANDEDRGLLISGQSVDMPLTVKVIGDPDTMATAMRIPGGVVDTIQQGGGSLTIESQDTVDIDAVATGD